MPPHYSISRLAQLRAFPTRAEQAAGEVRT